MKPIESAMCLSINTPCSIAEAYFVIALFCSCAVERSVRKIEDEPPWDQTLTPASAQGQCPFTSQFLTFCVTFYKAKIVSDILANHLFILRHHLVNEF